MRRVFAQTFTLAQGLRTSGTLPAAEGNARRRG
jgi:hypothetical protein